MRTLLRKVGQLVLVVIVVTFLTQVLVGFIPGDVAEIVTRCNPKPTTDSETSRTQAKVCADAQAAIRKEAHLDRNTFVRYGYWLKDFVQGDFGKRYNGPQSSLEVRPQVGRALPVSLEIMFWAQFVALLVSIPLGVLAAYRQGKLPDKLISSASFALLSMPGFALAFILSYYLSSKLKWLPSGYFAWDKGTAQHLKSLVIPVISLAAGQLAVYLRLLRSDLVTTLQQDFIAMAKAKGLKPGRILWRHALRPSSLTLLTVAGLQTGALIGGALVVEFIFSIPGMGQLIGTAIGTRQVIELQSYVAVVAIVFVLVNFLVDYLYSLLDPRIRSV